MTRYVWHLHTNEYQGDEYGDEFFASKQAALDAADAVAREFVGEHSAIDFEAWDSDGYEASARSFVAEVPSLFTSSPRARRYDQFLVRRRVWDEGETWKVEEGE